MGWFWGSKPTESEAVRNLDPSLRKFLEDETPAEQRPSSSAPPQTNVEILNLSKAAQPKSTPQDAPGVPSQSLFPDGRYADLWKTYRPLHEVEEAVKTDQDRLNDLVYTISERKYQVKSAAIENCAMETIAIQDCYKSANSWQMLTMCRTENRAFERCFEMQAKFLKALGFMGHVGDPESMERVQMHADKLYRQMLDQERRRKEAEERGEQVPDFTPVMSRENIARATGIRTAAEREEDVLNKLRADLRPKYKERLQGKDAEARELEMRLIETEVALEEDRMAKLSDLRKEEQEARMRRKKEGRPTLGDRLKTLGGWSESEDS